MQGEEGEAIMKNVNRITSSADKLKQRYDDCNKIYRKLCTAARNSSGSNSMTRKETVALMTFNPEVVDWATWHKLLMQYVQDFTHDEYKKTILLNKLHQHIQQTLTNYQSFDDCIESLKAQHGDPVRATKMRIAQFVNYCQEQPTNMDNVDHIAKDVAKIQGLTARLANIVVKELKWCQIWN